MKLGITTNVFAGPLKSREVDLEDVLAFAARTGIGSVELRDDSASLGESRVSSLASTARHSGIVLSYGIKNDMMAPDDRTLFERAVNLAALCGEGSVLRMLASQDALKPDGKRGYSAEDLSSLRAATEEYGKVASASGVVLAIENARDPLFGGEGYFGIADLVRDVSSGNVGLTFDPANATNLTLCKSPSGEAEVLRFVDEMGPRIKLTHYKTTSSGIVQSSIGTADVDNNSLLSRLSKVYKGVLCIEIPGSPGLEETRSSIEASLNYLTAKGLVKFLD